jgi:hypothetical protein
MALCRIGSKSTTRCSMEAGCWMLEAGTSSIRVEELPYVSELSFEHGREFPLSSDRKQNRERCAGRKRRKATICDFRESSNPLLRSVSGLSRPAIIRGFLFEPLAFCECSRSSGQLSSGLSSDGRFLSQKRMACWRRDQASLHILQSLSIL